MVDIFIILYYNVLKGGQTSLGYKNNDKPATSTY